MKNSFVKILIMFHILFVFKVFAGPPTAFEACPNLAKIITETDKFRVVHFKANAGQSCPMHVRPKRHVFIVTGATLKLTDAKGVSNTLVTPDNSGIDSEESTFALEIIKGTYEAILIEKK